MKTGWKVAKVKRASVERGGSLNRSHEGDDDGQQHQEIARGQPGGWPMPVAMTAAAGKAHAEGMAAKVPRRNRSAGLPGGFAADAVRLKAAKP